MIRSQSLMPRTEFPAMMLPAASNGSLSSRTIRANKQLTSWPAFWMLTCTFDNKMSTKQRDRADSFERERFYFRLNPAFLPLSLLRTLWKHKLMIAAVWAAGTAVTFLVSSRLPRSYQAEVLILVDSQEIPERYVEPTVTSAIQERLATLSQQILSTTRLNKIITALDLFPEERRRLAPEEVIELMRKRITVRAERGLAKDRAGAFRVAFQGEDPVTSAMVANELASVYIQENLQFRERQASGTSKFLESQLLAAKKELDEQESKVSGYKLQRNGELPEQENTLNAALSRLQIELQANQDALNRNEQTKALLANTLAMAEGSLDTITKLSSVPGGDAVLSAPGAQQQRRSVILREQLDAARIRYSEDHPDVQALKKQYEAAVRSEIADAQAASRIVGDSASGAAVRVPPTIARDVVQQTERIEQTKAQIAVADRDIARLGRVREKLLHEVSNLQARLERMPIREQELAALTRDYEISKTNYQSLLQKKLAADMAADMERRQQSERFTVLDPATPPEVPSSPKLPLIYAGGSLTALMLGMLAAFIIDFGRDVLLGEWELPVGTKVLARVPRIRVDRITSNLATNS